MLGCRVRVAMRAVAGTGPWPLQVQQHGLGLDEVSTFFVRDVYGSARAGGTEYGRQPRLSVLVPSACLKLHVCMHCATCC